MKGEEDDVDLDIIKTTTWSSRTVGDWNSLNSLNIDEPDNYEHLDEAEVNIIMVVMMVMVRRRHNRGMGAYR